MAGTEQAAYRPPAQLAGIFPAGAVTMMWAGTWAAAGWAFHGKFGLEKVLTALAMPVGIIWLALMFLAVQALFARRWGWGITVTLLWAILWLAGAAPTADWLTTKLESQYPPVDLARMAPVDVVVVLGGGTTEGPTRAQVGCSGDRVVMAAQIYHAGKTGTLATTGEATTGIGGNNRGPAAQTVEVWTGLGIPLDAIESLPGKNTMEEIQAIAERMAGPWRGRRVALLTSAMHLPRAMRLARSAGLEGIQPIPADFTGYPTARAIADFLPRSRSLDQAARCQHEFMAWLIGR